MNIQSFLSDFSNNKVVIVGAGALGTVSAVHLTTMGVGFIRIIDRDFVEFTNLQRQMLYDESDAFQDLPKVIASANKLSKINQQVSIEPIIADLNAENAEKYLSDMDIIIDGTDNFQTRYLINDVSLKHSIPWIYGGAVSSRGMISVFKPYTTPCFRCLFPNSPIGRGETCDTVGVISPITSFIGTSQAIEAMKLLIDEDTVTPFFEQFDIWHNEMFQMDVQQGHNPSCPACVHKNFEYLAPSSDVQHTITTLCGRETVQISPPKSKKVDFISLEKSLNVLGKVERNKFLLKAHIDAFTFVIFENGRILIQGTDDVEKAKSLAAKYIGL